MNRHYSHEQNNMDITSNSDSVNISSTNISATKNSHKKAPKRPPILPNEIKCILLQGYGSVKQLKAISIPR